MIALIALMLQTAYPPGPSPASVVQSATTVTSATGEWSVTWDQPFANEPRSVVPAPIVTGSPYLCATVTKTATGASGRCWLLQTNTLPSLLGSVPGYVISPFNNAAAGLPVMVTGRL